MDKAVRVTFLDDNGEKFFGEGPYRLLSGVEKTGSLHKTAEELKMSWSKAFRIVKRAEEVLGFPLFERKTGGTGGGGSAVTPEGKAWIRKYETYREACRKEEARIFREIYPEYAGGALIMASGEGKRFGGNKLMAPFCGKPMVSYILDLTALCPDRVVVTRNEEVRALCEANHIPCIFHNLPDRNDTVRLGLEYLTAKADNLKGALFCPADQPLLTEDTFSQLLSEAMRTDAIVRPKYGECVGAPVYFPSRFFPELMTLPQGKGGGFVAQKNSEQVCFIPVRNPYELKDIDTVSDLEMLENSSY